MRTLIVSSFKLSLAFVIIYSLVFIALVKVRVNGFGLIYRTSELIRWKGGNTWSNFQEHDPAVYHDVVVIGSSHAYRGYDPRIFGGRGFSMYNLGTTAQAPVNTWPIVKKYITRDNTGLLILDVYHGVFSNRGLESASNLIANVDDDLLAMDVAWHVKDPRMINLLMLRKAKHAFPPMYLKEEYVGRGYCSRSDSVPPNITYERTGSFVWDDDLYEAVESIMEQCSREEIPLVFVTHPMPLLADTTAHRRFAEMFRSRIKMSGLLYLDFALDHDLDPRNHFFDHNHLNQAGVDLFVPRLIDSLEALGYLRRPAP